MLTLINKAFSRVAPDLLMFDATASDPVGVAGQIRKFYFGDKNITKKDVKSLEEVKINLKENTIFEIELSRALFFQPKTYKIISR